MFFWSLDCPLKGSVRQISINMIMTYRPLCNACQKKPCAVNYHSGSTVRYRTRCDSCIRKKKTLPAPKPRWVERGYKKKPTCEHCGFHAKHKEQLFVYHVDGNLNNTSFANLKTICANCQIEIAKSKLGWVQGDLTPDL